LPAVLLPEPAAPPVPDAAGVGPGLREGAGVDDRDGPVTV
jgi:hypothetical protein